MEILCEISESGSATFENKKGGLGERGKTKCIFFSSRETGPFTAAETRGEVLQAAGLKKQRSPLFLMRDHLPWGADQKALTLREQAAKTWRCCEKRMPFWKMGSTIIVRLKISVKKMCPSQKNLCW